MGRLVALVCNDPDRLACVLAPVRGALLAQPPSSQSRGFDAWGIGLYQGGEVLLKHRPQPAQGPVDFYAIASELRTDTFLAHARMATVGHNSSENTPPFRFRSWLFTHHGTLPGFGTLAGTEALSHPSPKQMALADALRAEIPDFLQRNMHGQTDSELLFHLFLTRLHESGHINSPEAPDVRLVDAQAALHRTLRRLDERLREHGAFHGEGPSGHEAPSRFGALGVANGRFLMLAARGTPLYVTYTHGIRNCAVCGAHAETGRAVHHDHLRAVLAVADLPAPDPAFRPIADGTVLTVARDLTVSETALK